MLDYILFDWSDILFHKYSFSDCYLFFVSDKVNRLLSFFRPLQIFGLMFWFYLFDE